MNKVLNVIEKITDQIVMALVITILVTVSQLNVIFVGEFIKDTLLIFLMFFGFLVFFIVLFKLIDLLMKTKLLKYILIPIILLIGILSISYLLIGSIDLFVSVVDTSYMLIEKKEIVSLMVTVLAIFTSVLVPLIIIYRSESFQKSQNSIIRKQKYIPILNATVTILNKVESRPRNSHIYHINEDIYKGRGYNMNVNFENLGKEMVRNIRPKSLIIIKSLNPLKISNEYDFEYDPSCNRDAINRMAIKAIKASFTVFLPASIFTRKGSSTLENFDFMIKFICSNAFGDEYINTYLIKATGRYSTKSDEAKLEDLNAVVSDYGKVTIL
ncbi:hypothetical protein CI105_04605 [Candidatus Izimaplasma bacterium ZiA1]|uniref:hypothetical protein n=1 Tax=Candidatus Izimoplasma sp. ZiA1 TaxID=2024899 RepID=UPI000BAA3C57|nr:hypothetical protein CI105_04605 [Candidatus Izimaplasma bacterium ZiA1]